MRGSVIGKNSPLHISIASLLICATIGTFSSVAVVAQSGTAINAIICASSATISIDEPLSDSVVTESTVELKGSVNQASQIVVEVDGLYNSTESLAIGQLTYATSVQLSPGTHTIKLTAIDSCSTANSSVVSIVTYTPSPSQGSSGATTITGINRGESPGGIIILPSEDDTSNESVGSQGILTLPSMETPNKILGWLNIAPVDYAASEGEHSLSLARALTIVFGLYMATIGMSAIIVERVAAYSLFIRLRHEQRYLVVSRLLRVIGILMVIGGLFF